TPPSVGEPIRDRTTDAQALRLRTQTRTSCEGMISMALDRNLNAAVDAAWQQISAERIAELVVGLINIPSPTGEEADLAVWAADALDAHGVSSRVQWLDDRQANTVGEITGRGGGEDVLLYAPIDTLTVGDADEDIPWVGPHLRPDMKPQAQVVG